MNRLIQKLIRAIISASALMMLVNLPGIFHAGSLFSLILAALILVCSLLILREEKRLRMWIISELGRYKTTIDTILSDVDKVNAENRGSIKKLSSTREEPESLEPGPKGIPTASNTVFSGRQFPSAGMHSIMNGISRDTGDNAASYVQVMRTDRVRAGHPDVLTYRPERRRFFEL